MPKNLDPKRCQCDAPPLIRVSVTTTDGELLDLVLLCRQCTRLAGKPLEDLGLTVGDLRRLRE